MSDDLPDTLYRRTVRMLTKQTDLPAVTCSVLANRIFYGVGIDPNTLVADIPANLASDPRPTRMTGEEAAQITGSF